MIHRLLLLALLGLVSLGLLGTLRERAPDPGLIGLAVRATVFAIPSPTPRVVEVEVTRIVEIVRIIEVTRVVTVTAAPPTAQVSVAPPSATPPPSPTSIPPAPSPTSQPVTLAMVPATAVPVVAPATGCPTAPSQEFTLVPILGEVSEHPDREHGDLNLALRGYTRADAEAGLVAISGPTDGDPPQLSAVVVRNGLPNFSATYQVREWDWNCGERGCRGPEISTVAVSALGVATQAGEAVFLPSRRAEIYGGGFIALILYAEPTRLTAVYTREDSVANGYAIHLDGLCVDPGLLHAYRQAVAAGRSRLPAVRNGQAVGTAQGSELVVAIRDRGNFQDPRSRKDWWQGD